MQGSLRLARIDTRTSKSIKTVGPAVPTVIECNVTLLCRFDCCSNGVQDGCVLVICVQGRQARLAKLRTACSHPELLLCEPIVALAFPGGCRRNPQVVMLSRP